MPKSVEIRIVQATGSHSMILQPSTPDSWGCQSIAIPSDSLTADCNIDAGPGYKIDLVACRQLSVDPKRPSERSVALSTDKVASASPSHIRLGGKALNNEWKKLGIPVRSYVASASLASGISEVRVAAAMVMDAGGCADCPAALVKDPELRGLLIDQREALIVDAARLEASTELTGTLAERRCGAEVLVNPSISAEVPVNGDRAEWVDAMKRIVPATCGDAPVEPERLAEILQSAVTKQAEASESRIDKGEQ